MAEANSENDRLTIRFEGGLADDNRVPLVEFTESLRGWQDYLNLTSDMWRQGQLTLDKPHKKSRTRYEVRVVKPGSVEIDLVGWFSWFADGAGTAVVGAGTLWTMRKLWEWRKKVFQRQVRSHTDDQSVEEAAAALTQLAKNNGLTVGHNDDPAAVAEKLDQSMKKAMRPIKTSVERVTTVNHTTNIFITATEREKSALNKPYAEISQPEQVDEIEEREVVLREIDLDKRSASFHFAEPRDDEEQGLKRDRIVDGRINRSRDPYTKALHTRGHMVLNLQKKLLNSKTGAIRYEIGKSELFEQLPLFA